MSSERLHKHLHEARVLKMDSPKRHINDAAGLTRRNVGLNILPTILEVSRGFYPLVMLQLYLPTPAGAFLYQVETGMD